MKLSEAWRMLARTFERKTRDGTTSGWFALCPTLGAMRGLREWRNTMCARICHDVAGDASLPHCGPAFGDYSGNAPTEAERALNREARILACLMFAEEAKDAERAARKRAKQRAVERANVDDCLGFVAR